MNINYTIIGTQTPIVFLHGWGQNMAMMSPLVSLLSHDYKCVNLDLFGFGKSDEIENYQNFDDYVEELHRFLCEQDIHSPILIAHSFGARVAVRYAEKYPVSTMVISGGAGIRSPLTMQKRFRQFLHAHGFKVKGSYDYEHASAFLRKVLVEAVNQDESERMSKIKVPVLLIWGETDTQTPLWMAKKMAKLFENSTLIVFKGEDHFAYYHESNRFCFIVKEFLSGQNL